MKEDETMEDIQPEELGEVPLETRQAHAQALLSTDEWSREEVASLYGQDALPAEEPVVEIPEEDYSLEEIPPEEPK